jgi:pimeloyl-ACP methyl ester carboxylesterase
MSRIEYDEFGLFHENAAEFGLPYEGPPSVRREAVAVRPDLSISALVWGETEPELVLVHGGAQNAHTWDTVAMALDRPLVAVDLPGHGHSDGGHHSSLSVSDNAADVAPAIEALAPSARAVVGMSLGGLTSIALAGERPDLVRRLVLVDILPSVEPSKARLITDFVNGPPTFASFEDLLARTIEYNPTRSESSLRRGILHNAQQLEDGSWVWRHSRHRESEPASEGTPSAEERFARLWDIVAGLTMPVMLVRGMAHSSVLTDEGEAELRRRLPSARVERVDGAGHSVQGDRPVELATLIADFVDAEH